MFSNLTRNEEILVYLDYLGLSRKKLQFIYEKYSSYEKFFENFKLDQDLIKPYLTDKTLNLIKDKLIEENIANMINYLKDRKVSVCTFLSDDYPVALKNIPDRPFVLYFKGDINLLNAEHILGVVGTRKPSKYGREVAEIFVKEVVKHNVVTISGLAYGIDSAVAKATLEQNGKTIAVLGGGLNEIYPSTNTNLAEEIIASGGLLLSEYFPNLRPTQYTFPERNRIVSGLSRGVLIIEAGEGSGSLITANFALEQGKELFVVPANITSVQSKGCNRLIYEIPHCMVYSPDNILTSFGIKVDEQELEDKNLQLTIEQQIVYDVLLEGDIHFDELVIKTKLQPSLLNEMLTEMEIAGIVKNLSGNYYGV